MSAPLAQLVAATAGGLVTGAGLACTVLWNRALRDSPVTATNVIDLARFRRTADRPGASSTRQGET